MIIKFVIATIFFSGANFAGLQANEAVLNQPVKINSQSLGIEISANSAAVIDKNSGAVLFEKNLSSQYPIASITKLMTALVFLDANPDWEKVVTIQKEDMRPGNIVYAYTGEKITIFDLFNIMLISSANEAAVAMVRSAEMTEEEFVSKMNEKAKFLEMENTFFVEPTGLDFGNVSTAYDISRLAAAAFANPEISKASSNKTYNYKIINKNITRTAYSTNYLLNSFLNNEDNSYKILGAKTGYLREALYCLVAEIIYENNPVIITVLGSSSEQDRWRDVKGLAYWVYENYSWP